MTPQDPTIFGIPIDFVLFGVTLLCVAVFHQHTMRVALGGLATITTYKILFTGFKTGEGAMGFVAHVEHEWVILANLLCLLMGFALQYGLSRLPANRAIVILLSELVVAAVAAYWLAGESLRAQDGIGGALIVLATIATVWRSGK